MSQVSFLLRLNPSSFIYQAHFPGEPITPGVCIVQMGGELVEEVLQRDLQIVKVKNVKFLSVLTPQEKQTVTYSINKLTETDDGEIKVQLMVTIDEEVKAKLSLVLKRK